MIIRTIRFVAVCLFVMLVASAGSISAQAQGLKVGYTDHELIIANMPQYRAIQDQLQKEYESGQKELQGMMQEYQDKLDKYQKQLAMLSPERKQEREKEIADLQGKMQQSAATKEQGLARRQEELLAPLLERVQKAIDDVAATKGLDLVLRSQVGVQPVILYRNEKTVSDITEDVARKLGLNVTTDSTAASK